MAQLKNYSEIKHTEWFKLVTRLAASFAKPLMKDDNLLTFEPRLKLIYP